MESVLFRELCAVSLDLFYLNGAVRHTVKNNLLNKIETKRYSIPSLWEILIRVQLILISWHYCNLLITTSYRYGLEFSTKGDERKHGTEYSPHIQQIEIIDSRKVSTSFQSYLFEQQKTTW